MNDAKVNTRWVTGRRRVELHSIGELEAEANRVVAATMAGNVLALGNWSPAQVLQHVGKLIEFSFDGFPFRYSRPIAWITRALRLLGLRVLIFLAMRPGFRNPRDAQALEPDPAITIEAAAAYLRGQIARIRTGERMTQADAIGDFYTKEQWVYVHLRHAELHLSFLKLDE